MSQTLIRIADAIVAELNSPDFQPLLPESCRAERVYLPEFDLPDLREIKLIVLPAANPGEEMSTRDLDEFEYGINVGVQKKLSSAAPSEIDPLVRFAGEVADFLRRRTLRAFPDAIIGSLSHDPVYEADLLWARLQFASVVELTYRVYE